MNYYRFHMGDYLAHTAHLSVLEDGIYRRLIDSYYTREKPLPSDIGRCAKLIRAHTRHEKKALESVLDEFFKLTEFGWTNSRCDREIENCDRASKAGVKAISNRWKNQSSHTRRVCQSEKKSQVDTSSECSSRGSSTFHNQLKNKEVNSETVSESYANRNTMEIPPNTQLPSYPIPNTQYSKIGKPIASRSLGEVGKKQVSSDAVGGNASRTSLAQPPPVILTPHPIISLPLADKSEYPITTEQITSWRKSYPAVDVIQQLRHMREWCLANPTRRKTKTGIRHFAVTWLAKEQNRGGQTRPLNGRASQTVEEFTAEALAQGERIAKRRAKKQEARKNERA